jgi:CheY-like chemotaxis protein
MNKSQVILVAEDEDNDFFLLERALFHHSREVVLIRVHDGAEAMEYLSGKDGYSDRQRFPLPDLVLLDLKMPRVGGLEVLRWMRNDPRFRPLIVVILSSSKQESDVNQAYGSGANSYLKKPNGYLDFLALTRVLVQFWLIWSRRPSIQPPAEAPSSLAPSTSSAVCEGAPSTNDDPASDSAEAGR